MCPSASSGRRRARSRPAASPPSCPHRRLAAFRRCAPALTWITPANLALRFLLELAALAALAYWGFHTVAATVPQWAAGIGAPVAAAAAWGAVVAPKAALEVPGGVRLAVEAAVFGAAAVALAAAGQGVLAVA
ncbi:MAG TPA: DUF2568 domain-containing protein, partial [Gaiellales bacterium]|nr:DUF2568 domain-containing protein [Gaiellales bacterium]